MVLEDELIIKRFYERSEKAIDELAKKYGKLCKAVSLRITGKEQDAEDEYVYPRTYAYFYSDHVDSYEEHVFNVESGTDWDAYSLEARFWTCTNLTEGNWEVTFPITRNGESKMFVMLQ